MRTHPIRRLSAVVAALALTPAVTLAVASPAHAATTFTVVGTSDVYDSFLIQNVIKPGFEKAYPQYTLNYLSQGTTTAIQTAESGQAAALIVHAASAENAFVQQGFSLESFGRSIFWGDYVLVGPTNDPVGVSASDPHDVVSAFEKVAAAGAAGTAKFEDRTGSPGTSIQERALWALTTGIPLCTGGTAASGGGSQPTNGPTTCSTTSNPTWYQGNSGGQSANLQITNTCVANGGACYALTDRGTFNYLQSTGQLTNLKVVTRDNDPSARGGQPALVNAFHAYGINPAKFSGSNSTDAVAATDFLNFLTSPAEQQQIGYYLGKAKPFVPAAAPTLTADLRGGEAASSGNTVIKGNLANAIPGYPALSGQTVNLLKTDSDSPLAVPTIVGTAKTNYQGNYKLRGKLKPGRYYSVGVAGITKTEFPTLSPPFSDVLQPTTTSLGQAGRVLLKPIVKAPNASVVLTGHFAPRSKGAKGRLLVYAAHPGKKLKRVAGAKLHRSKLSFSIRTHLGSGKWRVELVYLNSKKDLIPTASTVRTVTLS